ncbi:MAG: hypothetical protein H0U27_13305, partial [Nitrosopumilus sp.]|nr:hypothetical protein [Nitrosopumilus sp.]
SLSSSAAIGLSAGAISFFATIYFVKFTNNYLLERECNRLKQEMDLQDKSIQNSMFSTEKFCSNYGKFLALSSGNVILSVKNQYKHYPQGEYDAVERYKKAFQEIDTLCAFYKVATK